MPTTTSPTDKAALSKSVRLSLALRLVRADGEVYAFNDEVRVRTIPEFDSGFVVVPETLYKAGHCRFPSNIEKSVDIRSPDNWEFTVLLGDYVTSEDVIAERFRGAKYVLTVYRRDTGQHIMVLLRGRVGESSPAGSQATLKMRGLAQMLQQEVLSVTSPISTRGWEDDELAFFDLDGDTDDGFAARVSGTIDAVDSGNPRRVFTFADTADFPSERFTSGIVTFSGGANDGFQAGVLVWDESTGEFMLDRETPVAIEPGDSVTAEIGPPRTIEAWRDYFGTGFGFPGQPLIPTQDKAAEITQI